MSRPVFLEKLHLRGFRSIRSETVTFDNPLFLVGRNASGKSNFVDAIAFLSECMDRPLQEVIHRRNGLGFYLLIDAESFGRLSGPFLSVRADFRLSAPSDLHGHFAMHLVISALDGNFVVMREQCAIEQAGGQSAWYDREKDQILTNVPGIRPSVDPRSLVFPVIGGVDQFSSIHKALSSMRVYSLDPNQIQGPHEPDSGIELIRNGANAASVFRRLGRQDPQIWQRIGELLSPLMPDEITVSPAYLGAQLDLSFGQQMPIEGMPATRMFFSSQMSDGTLRAIGLIAAVLQEPAPSVIAIEEPEAIIHPGALGAIGDLIQLGAQRSQVVVTTHSPELLDAKWIQPKHLRVVEWKDGETRISGLGKAPVKALQQHLMGAGELMRANALDAALTSDSEVEPELFETIPT
jgi:predicted ATPase